MTVRSAMVVTAWEKSENVSALGATVKGFGGSPTKGIDMADTAEAAQALADAIAEMAPKINGTRGLLELAEALAWIRSPSQSHGGGATVSK